MLRPTLLALSLAIFTAPVSAETVKAKLDNGLTVIVREDRRAPVVMSQIWYKIGSIDEKTGKSGLSHALEHMMFKGTPAVPSGEFSRRIAAMGGTMNAYTSASETVYHENIAKQHLPEVLRMEADRMVNLSFSDKEFANEMKVIREERRQRIEDSPQGAMYQQLLLLSYDKPSNQTPVIGKMADLFTLKANDLRNWYRQWYAPNNATVVIVGDVDARQTIDLVKQTFGHIPARTLPERQDVSEPNTQSKSYQKLMGGNTKQPMFMLAYRVPNLKKLDDKMPYALEMLTDILDGNSAARFARKFVRGGQSAMSLSASYDMIDRQAGVLNIGGMPTANHSLESLKQSVQDEIALIAREGVSEEELTRAKNIATAGAIYSRDSMASQAGLIGMLETNGFAHDDEDKIHSLINSISAADVKTAAQFLLQQRNVFVQLYPDDHEKVKQAKKALKAAPKSSAKSKRNQK